MAPPLSRFHMYGLNQLDHVVLWYVFSERNKSHVDLLWFKLTVFVQGSAVYTPVEVEPKVFQTEVTTDTFSKSCIMLPFGYN